MTQEGLHNRSADIISIKKKYEKVYTTYVIFYAFLQLDSLVGADVGNSLQELRTSFESSQQSVSPSAERYQSIQPVLQIRIRDPEVFWPLLPG